MPPLNPRKKHNITVSKARAMIAAYRSLQMPQCMAFNRGIVDQILAQPGCVGIRIYPAAHKEEATIILVGVDKNGGDMMGVIAEEVMPCPPMCPPASASLGASRR